MRFKLFIAFVVIALLWGGGQGVYTVLKNPSPLTMTCAEVAAKKPARDWVKLTDCALDFSAAGQKGKDKATELFVPLRPVDAAEGVVTHVVLATHDPRLLSIANGESTLEPPRELEGLVQFGIELKDKERAAVASVVSGVAGDFVLLKHGERPRLALSAAMLAAGLAALAGFVWMLVRKRHAATT